MDFVGEVQKEWRSAVDGSVITSSAKVGIAVAQQRAPPVNQDSASATGLPPSSTSPSSAYYTAAAAAAAAQNQLVHSLTCSCYAYLSWFALM